ncbi:TPA: helix-turn-helix domain-containing protein [Yersinia enterocolitica]|uniref:helix-turn-helix domain-containing protein n=1 Tax=Yersinia enterocolitica TaxID=630 RepID=UPI0028B5B9E7|nr:ImmA/IrrE family metallo-endopeptidase [Yersinia enterocolitica]HDL6774612.1 ImmA/IrrE family metallo-endopeptidase [Yersinia enterocolitica]HDM8346747.1 ImmA/IrrE family metallo-endopeptidase [Yersinia enterocolitica]HDM9021683.1 ImmA/IrrE family metallo-endopeptidase [Yersinia enterocolitica]
MNMSPISTLNREKSINPERLTEAREAKGLTMADLARLLDVSRQAISAFEKGQKNPSFETLTQISRVLGFPERFFLSTSSSPMIDGAVHFRSRSSTSKKERLMGRTKGRWVSLILNEMTKYATLPETKLPDLEISDFELLSKADIEELATQVRRFWGLGDGPIRSLTQLLENNGIVVANIYSGEKVDAFSFWSENTPIIVTDKSKTAVRMRFSIAHELGHLVMHQAVDDDYIDDKDLFNKVEAQANYFAACFLMPANSFSNEYFSPNLSALIKLKERWIASVAAITHRASSLRLMSDNQKEYVFRQLAPYRKREPLDDVIPREEPKLINKLANLLDEHNVIKKQDLIEMIGIPDKDFLAITRLTREEMVPTEMNVVPIKLHKK